MEILCIVFLKFEKSKSLYWDRTREKLAGISFFTTKKFTKVNTCGRGEVKKDHIHVVKYELRTHIPSKVLIRIFRPCKLFRIQKKPSDGCIKLLTVHKIQLENFFVCLALRTWVIMKHFQRFFSRPRLAYLIKSL